MIQGKEYRVPGRNSVEPVVDLPSTSELATSPKVSNTVASVTSPET